MKQRKKNNTQRQAFYWKYMAIILICLAAMNITTFTVCAHSPSTLTVSYNLETQELRLTASHQVNDPTTHYISKVEIKKNGAPYNTSLYTEQPDPNSFSYSYIINATAGDTIEVTASCNQGGSKTTQYTITQENKNNNNNDSSTPGFELLIFLSAVITILLLLRKK